MVLIGYHHNQNLRCERQLLLDDVFDVRHDDEGYDLFVVDVLHEHIERLQELPSYLSRCAEFSAQANSHAFSSQRHTERQRDRNNKKTVMA